MFQVQNRGVKPCPEVDLNKPHKIPFDIRWDLYKYHLNQLKENISETIKDHNTEYAEIKEELEYEMTSEDVKLMRSKLIVGMTTSCAARIRSALIQLSSPIMIVEEAAEVLESHVVVALTQSTQHVVLLGDHKQLRPSNASEEVKKLGIDLSLFERMAVNGIPTHTLVVQHRMRPEIRKLLTPSIYSTLEDHKSTLRYPNVTGSTSNVYFINHEFEEDKREASVSRSNMHEARYMLELANYLVFNGYQSEEITILSPYLSQVDLMLSMKGCFDNLFGTMITTVDNFQGEENVIILLSLVRNNDKEQIGFLGVENRICVALSRAKHGLFVMGNMDQLCKKSEIWKMINSELTSSSSIGPALPLECFKHRTPISITSSEDFERTPLGGCGKPCEEVMECGHQCLYTCHAWPHAKLKCQFDCERIVCTKHRTKCTYKCYEACAGCMTMVSVRLKCTHTVQVPCHFKKNQNEIKCLAKSCLRLKQKQFY